MGNAKYTSVPSRFLRSLPHSLPFVIPLSSSPSSSILRSVYVSRHISLSLSLSRTARHPHPRDIKPRRTREESPRDKFALFAVLFSLAESSRPAKVADVRRRLHLYCHYESAHVARHVVLVTRACVALQSPFVCVRMRAWGANVDCIIATRREEKARRRWAAMISEQGILGFFLVRFLSRASLLRPFT